MFCCEKRRGLFVRTHVLTVLALFCLVGGYPASGQWDCGAKINASDADDGDTFGSAVVVSDDVAVIAALEDDDHGSDSGSAYVFRFDGIGWSEEQKLLASDGVSDDQFGYSLSVSSTVAVVGAPWDDDNGSRSGSVYVFRYDGSVWMEEQKLLATDGVADDQFGYAVSVYGNVIIVGARGADAGNGPYSGAVYVYRFNGLAWVLEQKIIASDGASVDCFGDAVSLSGNSAIVGAPASDDNGVNSGSVYVFVFDGTNWTEQQKLIASDGAGGDYLGRAISVSGNAMVVGAYYDDDNGSNSGSAYVFRFDGSSWYEECKLLASNGMQDDEFGSTVSIWSDVAVVGARFNDEMGRDSGVAYVYYFDGSIWTETMLHAPDAYRRDEFGSAVAIGINGILAGACQEDPGPLDAGSAYIFEYESSGQEILLGDMNCDGSVNGLDVTPFTLALSDSDGYRTFYPDCGVDNADVNGDGFINSLDIDPFIDLLAGD